MRKQLSSIEFLNHFIYGIAGLIPMLVMMGFIGYFALSWIKEDLAIFIITFLFFLIAAFLAISMIRIYFNLVDFIITDQTFIIERFGKSAELPFSIIKETKHSLFPMTFGESYIKVVFQEKTTFGMYVYFVPTRLDENKRFHLDLDIKSLIDKKVIN